VGLTLGPPTPFNSSWPTNGFFLSVTFESLSKVVQFIDRTVVLFWCCVITQWCGPHAIDWLPGGGLCIVSEHRNVSCTPTYTSCLCTIISHNRRALKWFQNIVVFFIIILLFRLPTHYGAVRSCTNSVEKNKTKMFLVNKKKFLYFFKKPYFLSRLLCYLYIVVLFFACYGMWV